MWSGFPINTATNDTVRYQDDQAAILEELEERLPLKFWERFFGAVKTELDIVQRDKHERANAC